MNTLLTAVRAFIYMIGFILLWGWIALGVRRYDHSFGVVLPLWTEIVGIVLMIGGGILAILCVGIFVVRGKGTAAPFDAPREFVAVGPYRYVRNPIYIGGWIVLIGFGLYQHSLSILFFSLVWLLLAHFFVLFVEEDGLEKRFGHSYLEYKKSVNRWIPKWN
ncbi:MAG: isoprenylcysteine carboxylmethyltransferase family protein [Ignavibacteria bacterium]|nr:isoprenylcysteine carboxylmethyltransferase family protein [Ignavibacteria bacterium]